MSIVLNISGKSQNDEEDVGTKQLAPQMQDQFNGVAPSLEPISSSSSLNKKNKYMIRDFLGVENDFHRDDFERDSDSVVDRK